ncbi:MAG: HAD family hydrolase [Sedimenticola sp.]|nr:HAD family hydrolase [Sedimenticola sp.]
MKKLQALLWDVDGTLADTERDGHRVAFNRAFQQMGLDWDWDVELYGRLLQVTGGKERIRYYLDEFNRAWERPSDLDSFITELHRRKSQLFVSLMVGGEIPLRPGVSRLVNEAKQAGLKLAIVTTTTPANVDALLRQYFPAEGRPVFDLIAAGDVVPHKKPAPDIYLWALERLGLGADQCAALEDSHHGLRAARDAGLKTVVITVNGYTADEDFSDATLVVDQLGEAGRPCRVLQGEGRVSGMVDLGLLRQLHDVS